MDYFTHSQHISTLFITMLTLTTWPAKSVHALLPGIDLHSAESTFLVQWNCLDRPAKRMTVQCFLNKPCVVFSTPKKNITVDTFLLI